MFSNKERRLTMLKDKMISKNLLLAIVLLVIAVLSITIVSKYATSTEVHSESIQMLDDKKVKAMELTAGVAVTSTAISALPGDAATPIAEQVSELTGPLLIIVCAIYLEKFLLTTIGFVSFKFLIPIACVLGAIYLFSPKEVLRILAIKLGVFAMAISLVIPVSIKVTKLIETTFAESITQTYESAGEITNEAEKSSEQEDTSAFQQFLQGIGDSVTNLAESAKNALSVFIDAIAVLIITTCIIPIVVILFFLWIVKVIFGIKINIPDRKMIANKMLK